MRIPLTGGYYKAKSIIANAQRCLNIYPEKNPGETTPPTPVTHYQRPGLTLLASPPISAPCRGLFRASNGNLYAVIGNNVYYVSPSWNFSLLGTLVSSGINNVSFVDNGIAGVFTDNSQYGYAIELSSGNWTQISDSAFYGATRIDYLTQFFLLNKPNSNIFYSNIPTDSLANGIPVFHDTSNPSGIFGIKAAWPDNIVSIVVMHSEVWLIGALTTEVWYNAGASPFAFQKVPNVFIEHGCVAPYSVAKQDLNIYWLSQDLQGQIIVLKGANYGVTRISTHAIEAELSKYSTISDAIGFCYQQQGHVFYKLIFPTADKTWVFDQTTELWHEQAWTDNNGLLHRVRDNCYANAYGNNIVGDWQNGNLYSIDGGNYTDNGQPISRIRSFPHLINEDNRRIYKSFIADVSVGNDTGADGSTPSNPPVIYLRTSNNRGQSYGNYLSQSLGAGGQYQTQVKWWRLGLARDRVFELSWSINANVALQGAWVNIEESET